MATNCRHMRDGLTLLLQQILRGVPGGLSALARAAGVPRATLARVAAGELEASPELVAAVVDALARWSETCTSAAHRLRAAREQQAS